MSCVKCVILHLTINIKQQMKNYTSTFLERKQTNPIYHFFVLILFDFLLFYILFETLLLIVCLHFSVGIKFANNAAERVYGSAP